MGQAMNRSDSRTLSARRETPAFLSLCAFPTPSVMAGQRSAVYSRLYGDPSRTVYTHSLAIAANRIERTCSVGRKWSTKAARAVSRQPARRKQTRRIAASQSGHRAEHNAQRLAEYIESREVTR